LNRDRQVARPGGWLDWVAKTLQGGNMNGSDAPPASMVNEITWSRYVTLDSLIS